MVELVEASTALDSSLARGIADDETGRVKPAAQVLDRLAAKYDAMAKAQGE